MAGKLDQLGVNVGCLKHHGHGGEPDALPKGRIPTAFSGWSGCVRRRRCGRFQLTARGEWTLDQLIAAYGVLAVECLLIEGFKHAPYQKLSWSETKRTAGS
ncbi:molybdopterin-guanine dinucleotide biosynthesis protein MobB [Bacillus licheniformis]|nr:molybdopterin-guanine dinucleotide biosynthesis protein MobB [Bacillus licheniformis]